MGNDMADSYSDDVAREENWWDSEDRFNEDREQDFDSDARLDEMAEIERRAFDEWQQLCHDDKDFKLTWGDSFEEWCHDVFIPTESEE